MKNLVIIGAGGHGKVCANIANRLNKYKMIYIYDDLKMGTILGYEIVDEKKLLSFDKLNTEFFVAIGDNYTRKERLMELMNSQQIIATLIDPSAILGLGVEIGKGTVIMPNVVVNADAKIGEGVILNTATVVEHDCIVGKYTHISPSAVLAGGVLIGELTWIGSNSTVIQNLSITNNVIIGAGSVVTKHILHEGKYVGIPVKLVD